MKQKKKRFHGAPLERDLHYATTGGAEQRAQRKGIKRLFGIVGRHYKVLITSLALLLAVGYVHKLYWPHRGDEKFEYGYYAFEKWKEGKMRWTWRKACMRVKAVSDLFGFKVVAAGYNSTGSDGLTFKVFLDGEMLDRVHFFDGGSRNLYYYVPNIEGKEVEIRMEVDRTFNPLRMEINEDGRDLGVAVSVVSFLKIMPKDGVGFYKTESVQGAVGSGQDVKRFRWTGRRASQAIADCGFWILDSKKQNAELGKGEGQIRRLRRLHGLGEGKEGEKRKVLFLRCGHPDIEKDGVVVKVLGDGDLLREIEFGDHGWKKVVFKEGELEGRDVLTFEVSRTWNPKRMGVSEDGRDLGVAVAGP